MARDYVWFAKEVEGLEVGERGKISEKFTVGVRVRVRVFMCAQRQVSSSENLRD